MQVPPHLRLFCPLANSALSVGSAGSSWQFWVRNIMEKWLTWWFQGDYRFRENNLVDGKERRIPPGMAGAEQELNSGIIGLPVFQQFWFHSDAEGQREWGWRDVWDCLRGKEAGEMFGIIWEGRRLEGCLGCTWSEGAQTNWGVTCALSSASTFHIPSPSCSRL